MKRILITGASGFIGSRFARAIPSGILTLLDVKRKADARNFFRESNEYFDLAIHCAAVVGGRQLIESPLAHAGNLEIDAALFRWAERVKPGRVVYVSSVAVYPEALQRGSFRLRLHEDLSALRSHDPSPILSSPGMPDQVYGWAKLTGEYLASRTSVPVSIPRPFTVYGEGQDAVFPFANILAQIRDRRDPVAVWGSGSQVRDFIHVDDVVNGILAMAGQGIDGPVNLCTGRAVSLNELIAMMGNAAGYFPYVEHLEGKPEGLLYRVGDPGRLHEFYTPKITLEEGIRKGLQ